MLVVNTLLLLRALAFRQADPERAFQLLQVLSPFPYYKAGQFLFDLLEWEDFMLDGPEPPIVPIVLDAASLDRLAQWLDKLRSATYHHDRRRMDPAMRRCFLKLTRSGQGGATGLLVERYRRTLSAGRSFKDPYRARSPVWD